MSILDNVEYLPPIILSLTIWGRTATVILTRIHEQSRRYSGAYRCRGYEKRRESFSHKCDRDRDRVVLGSSRGLKLFDFAKFAKYYADAGQPRCVFFGSGVIKILAGVAMLVPRTRLYAAWSLLGMIFLIAWKPWSVHEMLFLVSQATAITLLIVLVWLMGSRRGTAGLHDVGTGVEDVPRRS
jgi:hypothetical protein